MSNVEDLVFVSKSNPHKGRWSTLPEDGALQRSQCWVQYCSQVVDSAIAIVHHSTDYVTICHYIYLYICHGFHTPMLSRGMSFHFKAFRALRVREWNYWNNRNNWNKTKSEDVLL